MNWKLYPINLPENDGEYLVTINSGKKKFVTISYYESNCKQYDSEGNKYYGSAWTDLQEGGLHYDVIAFMKKPEPY